MPTFVLTSSYIFCKMLAWVEWTIWTYHKFRFIRCWNKFEIKQLAYEYCSKEVIYMWRTERSSYLSTDILRYSSIIILLAFCIYIYACIFLFYFGIQRLSLHPSTAASSIVNETTTCRWLSIFYEKRCAILWLIIISRRYGR